MNCRFYSLFALLLFSALLRAQTVSTFANTPSNADVAVDLAGNVYVTSESSSVVRISPDGVVDATAFANGTHFSRASGLCFDNTGTTLYVTNRPLNQQGWITRVDAEGNSEVFASGLVYPGDITFDASGNLYVTEFNNNVRKITPEGQMSLYANSPLFNTALGIAWTPGDTLFVSSAHDGNIYKLIPGNPVQIEHFAYVDGLQQAWACGFMTYSNGALYITNGDNIIHRIDMQGTVTDFAGTGAPGGNDGAADQAQFLAPNGIGFSHDESKLYISEYGLSRIRVIEELTTSVTPLTPESFTFTVYPNPFESEIHFEFDLREAGPVTISIFDTTGNKVCDLTKAFQGQGRHRLTWKPEAATASGGTYIGRIEQGNQLQHLKIIHLKSP